jgi:carboxyl-terminal processing protease
MTRPDEFRDLLRQIWFEGLTPEQRRTALAPPRMTDVFLGGLLGPVRDTRVLAGSEGAAREQSAGNRYVGTGIVLNFNEGERCAGIGSVFRGGPMERAGGRDGDLITKIGERDTRHVPIQEIIELLRGEEGTDVTLELRGSAGKDAPRIVTVTRGPVVREALEGATRDRDEKWDYRIEPHLPIGYVKIRQVNGSAAHELRRIERQFRADGISAVILDLRSTSSHDVHQALLLADALMDGGTIGRVRLSSGHVQEFHADRECLFRDWPLAVLIDRTTSGGGEWIAAALQDNRACVVFGESSAGSAESNSIVHVPSENLSVQLPTGNFERPSGKPLQKREVPEATPLLVPVRRVAGRAEPAPGGVTPDRIVPVQGVAIVPGHSTTAEQQFFAQARQQQVRGDAVLMAAVVELRDRVDATPRRTEP